MFVGGAFLYFLRADSLLSAVMCLLRSSCKNNVVCSPNSSKLIYLNTGELQSQPKTEKKNLHLLCAPQSAEKVKTNA